MMSVDSFASIHQGRCLKSRQHYPALQGAAKASALHRNIVSIATCKLRRERETGRGLDLHNQIFSNGSRTDSKQATNGAKMRGIFQANGFACEESTHKHWASTNIGHPQTLGTHKHWASTNIGHPQGTSTMSTHKHWACTIAQGTRHNVHKASEVKRWHAVRIGSATVPGGCFLVLLCIQRCRNSEYTRTK